MDWVKLALLILQLAAKAVGWIEENKLRSEAERQLVAETRIKIDALIAKADAARAGVRADVERAPGSLRDDDGFRRD